MQEKNCPESRLMEDGGPTLGHPSLTHQTRLSLGPFPNFPKKKMSSQMKHEHFSKVPALSRLQVRGDPGVSELSFPGHVPRAVLKDCMLQKGLVSPHTI